MSSVNGLDQYLDEFRLEALERTLASLSESPEKAYFNGMLANRRGRVEESVCLLIQQFPALKASRPDRAALALQALADDYTKLYRYDDAAKAYDELLTNFTEQIPEGKLAGIKEDCAVLKLLSNFPPQSVSMYGPVALRAKRSTIGTHDITLTVNGTTAPWVLDTGASFSVVSASFARRLGIQASTGFAITRGTINGIENVLHVGLIPELHLGTATVRNVVVLIFDDKGLLIHMGPDQSHQIDAILGFPVVQGLGCISFHKHDVIQAGVEAKGSSDSEARLFMNQLKPLIECSVEGHTLLFALDTGADAPTFSVRYFQEFQDEFKDLRTVPGRFGGAGGTVSADVYLLPEVSLRIGSKDLKLRGVPVFPAAAGTDFDDTYGNLGRAVFAPFESFTVDFRRMTFSMVDNPH